MPNRRCRAQDLPRTANSCPSYPQPRPGLSHPRKREPFGLALALFGLLASILCFPIGALTGLFILSDRSAYWLTTKFIAALGLVYGGIAVLVIGLGLASL